MKDKQQFTKGSGKDAAFPRYVIYLLKKLSGMKDEYGKGVVVQDEQIKTLRSADFQSKF